ncbi:protein of unknown function [Paraburkholderia kururiensis]
MACSAGRIGERPRGARARRHPRRRRDHGGHSRPHSRHGRKALSVGGAVREDHQEGEAAAPGLLRIRSAGPLRVRLRHGRKGLLAQSADHPRAHGRRVTLTAHLHKGAAREAALDACTSAPPGVWAIPGRNTPNAENRLI